MMIVCATWFFSVENMTRICIVEMVNDKEGKVVVATYHLTMEILSLPLENGQLDARLFDNLLGVFSDSIDN